MDFQKVYRFWFGEDLINDPLRNRAMWWRKPAGVDEQITKEFSGLLPLAQAGELDFWKGTPSGFISLIVLLDQFPRHIFRGKPESFAFDRQALSIALEGLSKGLDRELHWAERQFFLLPLEHSEDLEIQKRSLVEFELLVKATPEVYYDYMKDNENFAIRHYEIIKQFGRFPHRNEVLGRTSSKEEIEFLKQPGSRF